MRVVTPADQRGEHGSARSVFTAVITVLADVGVTISMDGRGRWMDNVFIERLWRSVKYEEVYLHVYETGAHARAGLGTYFEGTVKLLRSPDLG